MNSALKEVNQLLKAEQNNPDALFLKAQLQYATGNKDQSVSTYQSIIEQFPKQIEAYNNLAAIYAQHDNLQAASEILEKAIHVDPVYATLYDNLRAVYWDMSQRHIRAALKLKPERAGVNLANISTPLPDTAQLITETAQQVTLEPEPKPEPESTPKKQSEPAVKVVKAPEPEVAEAVAKVEPKVSDEQQVKIALDNWVKAWSNRNAVKYVSFYTSTYHPVGKPRNEWVAGRRWNFKSKKFIKVNIDQLKLRKAGGTYIAKFRQSYQSDLYKDKVLKELNLTKQNGSWKISQETTLKAL